MIKISVFNGMTSKMPIESNLETVVQVIRQDANLANATQSYRTTHNKEFKVRNPLFAVACTFEGGKGKEHIKELTGCSLVDFDHILKEEGGTSPSQIIDPLKKKICNDPHTLMCYTTISGNGIRIIFRYELPTDYPIAFAAGNAYYERLVNLESDKQCKNVNRLSGLAYDPDVYFNPDATAFTSEEIKTAFSKVAKESKSQKQISRIATYYEDIIKPKLDTDGIHYGPGTHNDYVMRVGYMLASKRYARAEATKWAMRQFPEYDGVEQVFKSCFAKTASQKDSNGNGGSSKNNRIANVNEIIAFLDAHIKLRYNIITNRSEYLNKNGRWKEFAERSSNSLWKRMSTTMRVFKSDMLKVIESDYTASYHPFKEYLDGIPLQELEPGKDYIRELANSVRVKGDEAEQELWYQDLKKWLVGMIAGWIDEDAVNNVILVFIGEQGAYKTTWFNKLLPPELKEYFHTKTNSRRMNKDDLIALSQFGLICYEELDEMTPSEMNQLKAAVTTVYINERAAYAHYSEQRKHINTFCGTGNNPQFLNDPTGNRRWLPFEIEHIDSPYEHPFHHAGIFAQAYALYKSGYRYWFTYEEIQEQNRHNFQFEAPRLELELVDLYFRKPTEGENGELMTAARAMQLINCNMSQKLSAARISKAFRELDFKEHRTNRCRGYIVIIRTAEEIKAYQTSLALKSKINKTLLSSLPKVTE